mmetsp:Transcript_19914/g.48756  ORF Transcript_19914/g.48756 Transcript_19914/m.48756 type:complete len:523 (-) Transcript_19914:196-1764(-)
MSSSTAKSGPLPFPSVVARLEALYARGKGIAYGSARRDLLDADGEPGLGFVAHALQAALLAREAGYDDEVQVAALLHDVGWLLPKPEGRGNEGKGEGKEGSDLLTSADNRVWLAKHDRTGGRFLRKLGFSERVARLVEGHVQAKRYLCWRERGYYDGLSDGSKFTLKHQGGVMTDEEARAFEADAEFETLVLMRRWDEAAKVVGKELPAPFRTFADFKGMMCGCLTKALWGPRDLCSPSHIVSKDMLAQFEGKGYVVVENWLTEAEVDALSEFADEVKEKKSGPTGPFHTYERVGDNKVHSRTEGFAHLADRFGAGNFLLSGRLKAIVERLRRNRPHVMYKDKINYKFKGGSGGYKPHQDLYFALEREVDGPLKKSRMLRDEEATICMIAVDAMGPDNGGPMLAPGMNKKGWLQFRPIPSAPLKGIHKADPKQKDGVEWKSLTVPRGAVLIYGNMMPHQSAPNKSSKNRRALFPIYCDKAAVGGDAREKYYAWEAGHRRANNSAETKGKANRFFTGNAMVSK